MSTPLPDDLIVNAKDEVAIRKHLALVALGKKPADRAVRVGRLLDTYGRNWHEDQEIVISGRRIAWVGPAGAYPGEVAERVDRRQFSAVPGFGEVHKHIESSHLTPEWEAALVLPRGCTCNRRAFAAGRSAAAQAQVASAAADEACALA